ncbi:MAG: glycosyltransferase family 9 protein [Bdellovibrionaceae bacterium]|nr:glycosyltransferase family 9 protein [Bdellovibrio sp.]
MKKKVLLIRLDKIGDLICTLPADEVIDANAYDVIWALQKGMGTISDLDARKRTYFELDKADPEKSKLKLRELLKQIKPDVAISFQAPWWVNFELFKARVPIRTGVKSQWHSFLFLNKGLRQKRSLAQKHELDYNLELVAKAFNLKSTPENLHFKIPTPKDFSALSKFQLNQPNGKKYIVVHPGMTGSALNWTQPQYIQYILEQAAANKKVVITGTVGDEPYLNEIKEKLLSHPDVIWLQSKLNLNELVQILSQAEHVVAPSTGVAHIAASLGVKVHAIYSPVRVHHPRRWGARGPQVRIHLPPVICPGTHSCLGPACPAFFCMEMVKI